MQYLPNKGLGPGEAGTVPAEQKLLKSVMAVAKSKPESRIDSRILEIWQAFL
jgi:hypothetical protein